MLHIKFGLIVQAVSEEKRFEYYGNMYIHYPCILPQSGGGGGGGGSAPLGPSFFSFSESLIFSATAHFLQDFPFKTHLNSFPF